MGSPGERDPAGGQPASGLHKVYFILYSAFMERVLTCLRPYRLGRTFVLGIARLSPRPTSLFVVAALRMGGGALLFPICGRLLLDYLWPSLLISRLVSSSLVCSSASQYAM